ncbi:MAG: hypothetical protein QF632_04555, partial [Candidatus Woesearchaeota archaeon]|nr:hypothetical protein [Candidatus Woesearchaeota archaeon]
LVGKGVYDIANGYINNEPLPEDTYSNMSVGIGMVGLSSSMFLKDKNPGLLKKDPFWKRAYNWANEKIDSITSKQLPQTVPIPTYSRLRCNTQNQAA